MRPVVLFPVLLTVAILWGGPAAGYSQRDVAMLGIRLTPEIRAIVSEIELRTRKPVHSEFAELGDFQLGSSYIDDETGVAMVFVSNDLRDDKNKLRAVLVHELLHLRLRVKDFPTFIFSPTVKTAKGRAIDVEQEHVNELLSLIEHRVFRADMERFGVYQFIDLAGDTAADAIRRKGDLDSQADSINYARAILEYPKRSDVDQVRRLFEVNRWTRSLRDGASIANLITTAEPRTPSEVQSVFLRCMAVLFPPPRPTIAFFLTTDTTNKYYRRMVINLGASNRKISSKRI
jgi:hypothetical protein